VWYTSQMAFVFASFFSFAFSLLVSYFWSTIFVIPNSIDESRKGINNLLAFPLNIVSIIL